MRKNTAKELVRAANDAANELKRLRDVLLPHYEGKIGEPDHGILQRLRTVLNTAQKEG